jgi:hypothetical protein
MFLTQKVLEIAREAEAERSVKRPRGRPRKQPVIVQEDEEADEVSEYSSITLEDELALMVRRKRRSK